MNKIKWILIVDDEPDIIDSVKELLYLTFGEDKLKIVGSCDGSDATFKVKNQKFDCIITDMKMPRKEGDAFIASVRQNLFNSDTPVIMLTSYPNEKVLAENRFVYLVTKPYKHSELTKVVTNQLKLGGGSERLAADMVNNILASSRSFFTTLFDESQFEVESPRAMAPDINLDYEFVTQLSFYEDGIHNSFSMLFSNDCLEKIAEKTSKGEKKDSATVAKALGHSILKYSMSGKKNSEFKHQIQTLPRQQAHSDLLKKRGLIIPIVCGDLRFSIIACAEKKRRMAA